jgi:predicted ATPase
MEKLGHLKVAGFRSLRNLDMDLGDLTILIGANGSGKSNLVAFFDMLSFMLSGSLQLFVGRSGGGSSILHYGPKRTPVLSFELTFDGDKGRSEYGGSLAFASPDRLIFTDEHVLFQRPGEKKPYTSILGAGQAESDLLGLAVATPATTAATVARVFLNRLKGLQVYHFHDTSGAAYIRTLQDVDRNRALLSSGGNLASFLFMLQERFPAHFERIVSTVRLAVPYLKEFDLAPDRLNEGKIMLRWRDRNPDYEFGPHQLSDGSLRAIALITALLQPEELLPSLVIIDEPELGLHPGAVSLIGGLIKAVSSKRQVLVATQSPRLLAEFAPEDIVVVEREEDIAGFGESQFQRLSTEALGAWLDDYDLGRLYEMNVTGGGPQ